MGKLFLCWYYREFFTLVLASILILQTLAIKLCIDIGARPHVCVEFFNVCLNSH
jgi:hypothetical protein